MKEKKSQNSNLNAYKTLVLINLAIAVVMFAVRWWVAAVLKVVLSGDTTSGDGPALFAAAGLGVLMITPVTLILLIVAALITICQSTKLIEKQTLTMNSPWLLIAVLGVVLEVVAVFL